MSKFDENLLSLHLLRLMLARSRSGHNDDERQTLGNLTLRIWTIFNLLRKQVMTLTPDVYISVFEDCHICQKRELFLLLVGRQSRALSVVTKHRARASL